MRSFPLIWQKTSDFFDFFKVILSFLYYNEPILKKQEQSRMKKALSIILSLVIVFSATSVFNTTSASAVDSETSTALTKIDNTKWQYNSEDDVYYQIGNGYLRYT